MPKILTAAFCTVVLLISNALQSNAQCYTKELVKGKSIFRGMPDYIYVRSDSTYLGMTFTLETDENNMYKLEIKSDATNDFGEADSTVLQIENMSSITFALKPGISSVTDGGLKSTVVGMNISQQNLEVLKGRRVINVSAYRKGKKVDLEVFDEGFLRQQLECLMGVGKAGG